jgi:hypothetical protein
MSFSIQEFQSNLSTYSERASADKFDVLISLPKQLISPSPIVKALSAVPVLQQPLQLFSKTLGTLIGGPLGSYGPRELALQCEAGELPGIEITPVEYRHYGFTRRIPHHLNFTPLTLTFFCTGQMMEKKLFDNWMNLCIAIDGNSAGLISYREDTDGHLQYEATIQIRQYNQVGYITYVAKATECMPIAVSPLTTNWSDNNTHRVTVTFLYTKWVSQSVPVPILSTAVNNFTNELGLGANFGVGVNNIVNQSFGPTILSSIF